jgi:hypothetical protein
MTFDEHERYFKERCVCYVGGKDDLRGAIREAAVIEKKKAKRQSESKDAATMLFDLVFFFLLF